MSSASRPCRGSFMVQVVWHGAYWRTPSCAASEGSDMTGSSFISIRGVFRDLSGLPVFYQDLLRTWKLFTATRSVAASVGEDLLAEPLLHKLRVQVTESPSVRQRLVLAEVTRVGDLLDYDRGDWLDPLMLALRMGLSRPRTPLRVLQEVRATLPPAVWRFNDKTEHSF
ncbi:unnamed protein product [Natator depressus]